MAGPPNVLVLMGRYLLYALNTISSGSIVSIVLLKCLIATTAYDDRFVTKLLSNRTVVDNGLSLNGTTLHDLRHNRMKDHSVRCVINVENWTAWRLKDALPHNHCGYIDEKYTAVNVEPATREVMLGYKQAGTATGTCGTVSWQIEHLDTRLIVMWSVPFNFNIHDSYFGVGMIFNRGRFSSSNYWFNQMYYSEKGPYKRGSGGQTITYENSAVVVVAHMESSTYHPMLNISVIPQVRYKLASKIWRRLYKNDRAPYTGGASPVRTAGTPPGHWSRATILATILVALLATKVSSLLSRSHFGGCPVVKVSSIPQHSSRRRSLQNCSFSSCSSRLPESDLNNRTMLVESQITTS